MTKKKKSPNPAKIIGAKYFPYPTARPGQKEFMTDISHAFRRNKHLVAHAPTGIGKTVAALTPAVVWCRAKNKKLLFLTSKQSQHHMAVETLRMIKDRIGRIGAVDIIAKEKMCSVYASGEKKLLCQVERGYGSCPLKMNDDLAVVDYLLFNITHVEDIGKIAERADVCPHAAAMDAAVRADVVVCDYNYIFSPIRDVILSKLDIDLEDTVCIIDEAHNLPDRIRENLTQVLTPAVIKKAVEQCRRTDEQLSYYLRDLGQVLADLEEDMEDELDEEGAVELGENEITDRLNTLFSTTLSGDASYDLPRFIHDLTRIRKKVDPETGIDHVSGVIEFLKTWAGGDRTILRLFRRRKQPTLEVYPLDPGTMGRSLFKEISNAILMSGTLFPGKMYAELLGMDPARTVVRDYPSPFPRANKLILGMDLVTTLYKRRNTDMFRAIADQIGIISSNVRGNIAAFFPSYKLLSDVRDQLESSCGSRPILMERSGMNKREKRELLEELISHKEKDGAVMFAVQGGSLSEGIDYRENLLQGICIVGFPLPPPTVRMKGLMSYYRERYGKARGYYYSYVYPAMNKVLQASGRPIRSYSDRAFIVLMDHRYGMKRYRKLFPPDFNYVTGSDVHERIKEFLGYTLEKLPQ